MRPAHDADRRRYRALVPSVSGPTQLGSMFQPYRDMARIDGLRTLLTWSLVGRLHLTGLVIAMTFLAVSWTESFALAGLITAAFTVGSAVGGPLRGRSADRRSADRLLLVTAVLHALCLAAFAVLDDGAWLVAPVLALLAGLSKPPVAQLGRAIWPRLATGKPLDTIYTVESTLQELVFVVGPVAVGVVTATAGPRVALGALALLALVSTLGFAMAVRRAGMEHPTSADTGTDHTGAAEPDPAAGSGSSRIGQAGWVASSLSLLRTPGVLATLALFVCLIGAMVTVNLTIIAWAYDRGQPELAGILAAVWAVSSLVGGFAAGGFSGGPNLRLRATGMALGIVALIPVLPPVADLSPWVVGAALTISGLFMAPTVSASNSLLSKVAPEHRRAESFGWAETAATVGAAVSTPLCGWLIDTFGHAAGAGGAAALAVSGVCFVLVATCGDTTRHADESS